MSLAELISYESDLIDSVLSVLREDTDIEKHIGSHNISATLSKNKLPLQYASRAIQVKDPSTDFDNTLRSKYKEFARSRVEIYCYEDIIDDVEGETLTDEDRILKTVGLVISCMLKLKDTPVNGFYWFMLQSIESSEPIAILGSSETFDLVGCKTLVYDIRKDIKLT